MGNYFSLVYYPMLSLFILLSNCLGFSHWEFFEAGSCVPFFFEHFLTFWNYNIFWAHLVYYSIFFISLKKIT